MAEEQQKHPNLELVYQLVTAGENQNISYSQNKIKALQKYLLQFNRLTLKKSTTLAVHQ